MPDDELSMEELDQVGTMNFSQLNEFMTAFEKGDMEKTVQLGQALLNNPAFDQRQLEEIVKIIDQAKNVMNHKEETKGFGL